MKPVIMPTYQTPALSFSRHRNASAVSARHVKVLRVPLSNGSDNNSSVVIEMVPIIKIVTNHVTLGTGSLMTVINNGHTVGH